MLKIVTSILVWVAIVSGLATAGQLLHIRTIKIGGDVDAISEDVVREGLRETGKLSILWADLSKLEKVVNKEPLVYSAHASVVSPNLVWLEVEARRPVAIDKQTGALIDAHGELYSATAPNGLTEYYGPVGQRKKLVALLESSQKLLAWHGLMVKRVDFNEWSGWSIKLDNGWGLHLGADRPASKVARFSKVARNLLEQYGDQLLEVNLRYREGMVLAGPAVVTSEKETPQLEVEARRPVAINKQTGALIDAHGELYSATAPNGLTEYYGPVGQRKKLVALLESSQKLLAWHGLMVKRVDFNEWSDWSIKLDNGWGLHLGADRPASKVARFSKVAQNLLEQYGDQLLEVNLRYRAGMVLAGPTLVTSEKETPQ